MIKVYTNCIVANSEDEATFRITTEGKLILAVNQQSTDSRQEIEFVPRGAMRITNVEFLQNKLRPEPRENGKRHPRFPLVRSNWELSASYCKTLIRIRLCCFLEKSTPHWEFVIRKF